MDDSVSRFWDRYIEKTASCSVPDGAGCWYVMHVEAFTKTYPDTRLAEPGAADITKYLEVIDRKPTID